MPVTISVLIALMSAQNAYSAGVAGYIPTQKTKVNQLRKPEQGQQIAANGSKLLESELIGVPTLDQLNEEIDKNNTLIKKNPLPNFKLPPSTKKIIDKLPADMSDAGKPVKSGKKQLKVNSSDFTGDEPEVKPGAAQAVGASSAPARAPGSMFEIKVSNNEPVKDIDAQLMASKAYQVGQYESAIAIYKDIVSKQPNSRDGLFGLATSYHKNKQGNQAKIYYAKLLDLYPYDTEGQNNFLSLVAEEAPEDALKELDNLAASNPEYAPIYAHKAMIYIKLKDDMNAMKNLYKALQLSGDNTGYKYNLAVLFDKNGYYENAGKLYNDLIEDDMKGVQLPVARSQIEDRVAFIRNKTNKVN